MSQFGTIFDRGISEAVGRRLGLGDTSLSLMPELAVTLALESMPEMMWHLGWRRLMASGTAAAVAASFATVQIRMPKNTNSLCVIEACYMRGPASAEIVVNGVNTATELANPASLQTRDTLGLSHVGGNCFVSHTAAVTNGTQGGGIYNSQADVPAAFFPLILRPEKGVALEINAWQFQFTTVNVAVDYCLVYRERIVNDQENAV